MDENTSDEDWKDRKSVYMIERAFSYNKIVFEEEEESPDDRSRQLIGDEHGGGDGKPLNTIN